MTAPARTILAIFAHPDDEIGVGSTLAYYSDQGVRTVLLCASRGEACTIFCDDCATPETIAEVRTIELSCACAHLGIAELRWLDWPDGGISQLPRATAVGELVHQIRDVRPDVILTHPEHGLYPHPDHLALWEMTREAFSAAADPDRYPEAGAPWATARLFVRALPQSMFDALPALAEFRVELNGTELPFHGTPDALIDVVMDAGAQVPRRMAAWDCHKSQHNPKGFSSIMPDGMREDMAAHEAYVLAAARVLLPDGPAQRDLLAGLPDAAAASWPAEVAEQLRAELAAQRSLLALAESYGRRAIEPADKRLYAAFADRQQEVVHVLARALRQAGEGSGAAGLVAPGAATRLEIPAEQQAHLRSEVVRRAERYRGLAAAHPAEGAVWDELVALAEAQLSGLPPA